MKIDERTQKLKELMDTYQLTAAEVGEILGRNAQTVRVWRSSSTQHIPADALRLLEMTLLHKGAK
jgi:hypothetical protein